MCITLYIFPRVWIPMQIPIWPIALASNWNLHGCKCVPYTMSLITARIMCVALCVFYLSLCSHAGLPWLLWDRLGNAGTTQECVLSHWHHAVAAELCCCHLHVHTSNQQCSTIFWSVLILNHKCNSTASIHCFILTLLVMLPRCDWSVQRYCQKTVLNNLREAHSLLLISL